jgi:hypothetical protein
VVDPVELRAHRARRVLEQVAAAGAGGCVTEPADRRRQLPHRRGRVGDGRDQVTAADVQLVLQRDRDRERRGRLLERACRPLDRRDPRAGAAGQHRDLVADAQRAGRDLPGVEPALGADHVLHRQPCGRLHAVERHRLEVRQQRLAAVPRHPLAPVHDVVAVQRGDRDERDVVEVQPRGPLEHLAHDRVERLLGVVDEVHLVHADHDVADTEQLRDRRVAARLLGHPVARVDEDQREVGRRRAGDHVARVLRVPRRVGDDEPPPGGGERPVGDVDRDALLALGAQAVGEQREVERRAALGGHLLDVLELVGEHGLGVVQQAADQRGLAVVDGARRGEAEEIGHG